MAQWVFVTGMPFSGYTAISNYIGNLVKNRIACYTIDSPDNFNLVDIYRSEDARQDLIIINTKEYIDGLSTIIPDDRLFIISVNRDIRMIFSLMIEGKQETFENVFSRWTLHEILKDHKSWNKYKNVCKVSFELFLDNPGSVIKDIRKFLSIDYNHEFDEKINFPDPGKKHSIKSDKIYHDPGDLQLSMLEIGIIQYFSKKWLTDNKYFIIPTPYNYWIIWKLAKMVQHIVKGTIYHRIFSDTFSSILDKRISFELSGKEFIIHRLEDNVKIKLYKNSQLSRMIYSGEFEKSEQSFIRRFLKKNNVFIDIGANIGLFSLIASPIVGDNGKIIAIEPASKTVSRLHENISLNGFKNITVIPKAISDIEGEAELFADEGDYDAWNSLGKPSNGHFFYKEKIHTITLEQLVRTLNLPAIDLIKIDVEGWEIPVLKGAGSFLRERNSPVLIVEFTDQNALNAGYNCQELYRLGTSLGYKWYEYNDHTRSLFPTEMKDEYPYQNLVAVKDINGVSEKIK